MLELIFKKKKFIYKTNKTKKIKPNKLWVIVLCPNKLYIIIEINFNLLPKKDLGWSISGNTHDKKQKGIIYNKYKILNKFKIFKKNIIKDKQKIKWFFIHTKIPL